VPGYPWTPLVFLLMVAVLLALLVLNNPLQAFLGLCVVAAALPVYQLIWRSGPSVPQETFL
jgi:APA family basic amino acid/polyamine antiporter